MHSPGGFPRKMAIVKFLRSESHVDFHFGRRSEKVFEALESEERSSEGYRNVTLETERNAPG